MTKCNVLKSQLSASPSAESIIHFKTSPSVDGSFNETQNISSEVFIFSGPPVSYSENVNLLNNLETSRTCVASDVDRNRSEENVNRLDKLERSVTPVKGKVRTNSPSLDTSPLNSTRSRRGSAETKCSAVADSVEYDGYSETSDDSSCDDNHKVRVAQCLSQISVRGMRAFARSCRSCFRGFFRRKNKKQKKRDRSVSPTVVASRTVQVNSLSDMAGINSPLDCRLHEGQGENSRKKKRPGTRSSDEKALETIPKTSTSLGRRSGYHNVGTYNNLDKRKLDLDLIEKYLEECN